MGGWVKFDCSQPITCIKTDWRALSYRPVVGGGGNASSSGGGGIIAGIIIPPSDEVLSLQDDNADGSDTNTSPSIEDEVSFGGERILSESIPVIDTDNFSAAANLFDVDVSSPLESTRKPFSYQLLLWMLIASLLALGITGWRHYLHPLIQRRIKR
jgi:hypothetical protein